MKSPTLDTVKIHRSLVKETLTRKSDSVIVSSTINLAHNLSFKVVAEGAEDQDTLDTLEKIQCDQAQGGPPNLCQAMNPKND